MFTAVYWKAKMLICRYFLFIIYNSSVARNQSLFFVHRCQCSQGGRIYSEFGALLSQINQLNSLSIANRIYGTRTITFHKVRHAWGLWISWCKDEGNWEELTVGALYNVEFELRVSVKRLYQNLEFCSITWKPPSLQNP